MRLALLAVLALAGAPAPAADSPEARKTVTTPKPSQTVASVVAHQPPEGWRVEEYANGGGADPVVAFVAGSDRIAVRVFGAPGSAYKNSASFLAGPAASTMGRKPEAAGSVSAAGRPLALYRRKFPVNLGAPHAPSGPAILGTEVFCLLPASAGRFVVLSYARESPVPDLERRGEKAWAAFLKTVKLPGRKT